MDILVRHNGVNITDEVLNYEREHKICTGIGTLTIDIERTTGRTFDPWDSIDIHENGDFKVRYFISDIIDSVPEGKVTLECQDESKRLVDFFIPESYIIETPSYTRTWIETFLDMAGVSYQFNTSSPGNLLSNHTQLGLTSAYEQILLLLQLSGWYMYFDGDGKAVIGSLETDLSGNANSVDRSDILSINRASDDKMLRNRALVLGAFDPFTLSYAAADIVVHTRWNYDRNDVRSMVVANSNIPNAGSAYGIANMLIKEFARITIVKRLELHGARDFNLGEVCRVDSTVWRGKGLITTFGVRMSKDGLITDLTLDERCPRLFGFFDFGDYVYVGTYGDGVWRKHLKFDPTWYDFSDGLTNLEVTDLHINNGIFGSVGSNGDMHYANTEEGPWHPLTLIDLPSSEADIVASGEAINYIPFSGISARATIVDKLTNNVKFGVDTASGINNGDYFLDSTKWVGEALTLSGIFESFSGVAFSGPIRGWIVEYDAFTGQLVGGVGSGIYPVSLSGEYNFSVIDLENDGYNDYVSVRQAEGGQIIPSNEFGFNFGKHTSKPAHVVADSNSLVSFNLDDDFSEAGKTLFNSVVTAGSSANLIFSLFNNESAGEREIVWTQLVLGSFTMKRNKVLDNLTSTTDTSPAITGVSGSNLLTINKVSTDVYRLFHFTYTIVGNNETVRAVYRDWDIQAGTLSSDTELASFTINRDATKKAELLDGIDIDFKVISDNIFIYALYLGRGDLFDGTPENYIRIYGMKVNINSLGVEYSGLLHTENYNTAASFNNWTISSLTGNFPYPPYLFQLDDIPTISLFTRERNTSANIFNNHLLYSRDGVTFSNVIVQTTTSPTDPNFLASSGTGGSYANSAQLTSNQYIVVHRYNTNGTTYFFNGETVSIVNFPTDVPEQIKAENVTPIFGVNDPYYVALVGSDYYWCNPQTGSLQSLIDFPGNFTPVKIFSKSSDYDLSYYWHVSNSDTGQDEIVRYSTTGFTGQRITPFGGISFSEDRGIICGNFFVDYDGGNTLRYLYLDNQNFPNGTSRFLVLQRNGLDYTVIEEEEYPIRTDISNQSPVLTVGSGDNSFVSNYVYGDDLEVIFAVPSGFPRRVDDYRYTLLEPTTLGEVASGVGVEMMGLYVTESGIFTQDIRTYSGGWQAMYEVPEGHGTRIETSNYGLGGQYIFVTASGDIQNFYQLDPGQVSFTSYSGLPDSRATIIRLDDRN